MSFDEDIKQVFERHAEDISPTPGAWSGVERRIRRSHRIRAGLAAAGGVAAIVAAAFVVPSLVGDRSERVGPPAETPSPAPVVPADWHAFRNERDGYWLRLPAGWRMSEFEAHVTLTPPDVPRTAEDQPDFSLELWLDFAALEQKSAQTLGTGAEKTTVAGRPARKGSVEMQCDDCSPLQARRTVTYLVDWTGYEPCGFNDPPNVHSDCAGPESTTLWVVVSGRSDTAGDQWSRNGQTAEVVVRSLTMSQGSSMPAGVPVRTRRGAVAGTVPYDHSAAVLVRFMDARFEGSGAEPYIAREAAGRFDARGKRPYLYSRGEAAWNDYAINGRNGGVGPTPYSGDAEYREYDVTITEIVGDGWQPWTERLGVGPADGRRALIRFASSLDSEPS